MKIKRIKQLINDNEAAIITSDSNRFYFTGFQSSAGVVYISKSKSVFLIDFRYYEKADREVKDFDVVLCSNVFEQLNKLISDDTVKKIYIETDYLTLSSYSVYCKRLNADVSTETLLSEEISKMRAVKTPYEIECIKTAQSFTDQTFEYILGRIEVGRSEIDIMLDMEFYMRKLGSEGIAFDTIVLTGKNTSVPHGVPSEKIIEDGDLVLMDFGAKYNGYCSDMTRTVGVGNVSGECIDAYELVLETQLEAIKALYPDMTACEVDSLARDILKRKGYDKEFGHALGHSVGIDVHESPSLNKTDTSKLTPGNVVTIEPGIYLNNKFGIRIEDIAVITEKGHEIITKSSKEFKIIK